MNNTLIEFAKYLRNNFQRMASNKASWQNIRNKKIYRTEEVINLFNKNNSSNNA